MSILNENKKKQLNNIKNKFEVLIETKKSKSILLEDALITIKNVLEETIKELAEEGKTALIRSQKPIKLIHEVIKSSLVEKGINPKNIKPSIGTSKGELKLTGFLKKKDQDICILPNNIRPKKEILLDGLLANKEDEYGKTLTENILSINVRSQLSSLGNNIDTLYERTFAEALNLHMRCPKMCLGEFYMIPVYEYNKHEAQKKKIEWVKYMSPIETYIQAFNAINLRNDIKVDHHKYEKVCLLIVDFSKEIPKIYNNDEEIKNDGLIKKDSTASIENLNYETFINELLKIYYTRFPTNTFN